MNRMRLCSESDVKFIEKYYPSKGVMYCVDKLNLDEERIRRKVSTLGLRMNDKGLKVSNDIKQDKIYNKRMEKFDPIFNESQCYALGLLWADGYLYSFKQYKTKALKFEVVFTDYGDFHEALESLGKVSVSYRDRPNRQKQACAVINNYGLSQWLYDMDYSDKSSVSPSKILKYIPKEYVKDFVRGWIDGDGCFYHNEKNKCYQFSLAGSYDQDWSSFIKIMKDIGIDCKATKRKQIQHGKVNGSSQVRFCKTTECQKLINYIYDNPKHKLERKYAKAMKFPINDGRMKQKF